MSDKPSQELLPPDKSFPGEMAVGKFVHATGTGECSRLNGRFFARDGELATADQLTADLLRQMRPDFRKKNVPVFIRHLREEAARRVQKDAEVEHPKVGRPMPEYQGVDRIVGLQCTDLADKLETLFNQVEAA